MADWNLYVLDRGLNRIGELDDYTSVDAIARFNDVGTWTINVDGRSPLAPKLASPGYGMELTRDDVTVMSGLTTSRQIKQDGDSREYTVSGVDHNVWLKWRVVHPCWDVAAPGPYTTRDYSVVTGAASTVIMTYTGQNMTSAALLPRRVTNFANGVDPLIGSTVTGRGRWDVLLKFIQDLAVAGGNLGFRVKKIGTVLQFQVYQPADLSTTVRLSTEMGNLYGYQAQSEVSTANFVYVGGGGEGTARTIYENQDSSDVVTWNARIEVFQDRRDTTDPTELSQAATTTLTDSAGKSGLTVNPVDINNMQFLKDYQLGDRVTYVLDGVANTEIVREAHISLTPDGPQTTIPALNSASSKDILALFRELRAMKSRLLNLERR